MDVEPVRAPQLARGTRASDAERDRAARVLRTAYTDGRLDHDELEQRLALVLRARTRTDLRRLTSDLPRLRRPSRTRVARVHRALLRWHVTAYATGNATVVGVWAAAGAGVFWPVAVLVPTSAAVGMHAWVTRRVRRVPPGGARRALP